MSSEHKWTFWGFQSSDYRAAQLWLEEMADRGWELDKLPKATCFRRARFHRVQRAGLRYLVDIPARKRFLDKEDRSDTQNYLRSKEGWVLVGESGGLKVFKSAEGRIPARPQMEWEGSYWQEALRPNISTLFLSIAAVLVFLLIILSLFKGASPGLHQLLLSNASLLYCALMAFCLLWALWDMLHGVLYYLRCRRALRLDEDPPVPGLLSARLRGVMASLAALLLLLSSVVSLFSGYTRSEYVDLADTSPRLLLAADRLGLGPFSGYYKEENSIFIGHIEGYQWLESSDGRLYQDRYDCRYPWVAGMVLSDLRRDAQPLAELTAADPPFDAAYASPDGTRLLVLEGTTVFSLDGPLDFTAPDNLALLWETLNQ